MFGRKPSLPQRITQEPEFSYSYEDYHKNLQLKLNKSFQIAKNNIIQSKIKSKIRYDRSTNEYNFRIGEYAYLKNNATKQGNSKKLSPTFLGPYKIIKINDNETVVLKIKNKFQTYHKNLLKPSFVLDEDTNN